MFFYYNLHVYLFLQLRRIHSVIYCRHERKWSGLLRLLLERGKEESCGERLLTVAVIVVLSVVFGSRISYSICYVTPTFRVRALLYNRV